MVLNKIEYVNDGTLFHIIIRNSKNDIEITVPVCMIKFHNESIDEMEIKSLIGKDELHVASISPSYDIGPNKTYFYINMSFIESKHKFIISDMELKPNSNVLGISISTKLPEEIPNVKSSKRRTTESNNGRI